MSCKKALYLGVMIVMLLGGCGLKEGVVQKEPQSFLWFTGNTHDAVVYIDDLAPIILKNSITNFNDPEERTKPRSSEIHYAVSPGKHTVIVKRSGEVIVHRKLLLGNGITKEILIP